MINDWESSVIIVIVVVVLIEHQERRYGNLVPTFGAEQKRKEINKEYKMV